jgi:hypothetical protein
MKTVNLVLTSNRESFRRNLFMLTIGRKWIKSALTSNDVKANLNLQMHV